MLEVENKDNSEKLQSEIQKKVEEIDSLQKDGEKLKEHVVLLETQVSQLDNLIKEKEQLILRCMEREKKLEDQLKEVLEALIPFYSTEFCRILNIFNTFLLLQNQVLLTAAESKLAEAKKQYDQMLESKQLELSRHLKELSLRNDQVFYGTRELMQTLTGLC